MTHTKYTLRKRGHCKAFSLLEMVMAAVLVTGTVVPALAVIRDAMAQSREMHNRKLLASFAVMLIEDQSAYASTNWTNLTDSDDLSGYGFSDLAYSLAQSDDPVDGGIDDQLMSITVTVFEDDNADLLPDANEMQVTYRTKVAKLNSYENEEQ